MVLANEVFVMKNINYISLFLSLLSSKVSATEVCTEAQEPPAGKLTLAVHCSNVNNRVLSISTNSLLSKNRLELPL
jgi:hypothetical protein